MSMMSLWLASPLAMAAEPPPPPLPPTELYELRRRNLEVQQVGMGVLAGWGTANLATGGIGWATNEPGRTRAFWQGNAAWNVVNLGIAGFSLASQPALRRAPLTEVAVRKQVKNLETALAINAGLDVGYVLTGFLLRSIGARQENPQLQGFGDALLLQGGFLFVFDTTLFAVSRRQSRGLRRRR